jgi:DNA-binding MarR family transcriptional regulator
MSVVFGNTRIYHIFKKKGEFGVNYEPAKSVIRTCYHILTIYSREFQETGYSYTEIYTLTTIGHHPGITAREITEYISRDKGYMSRILKKLTEAGLVRSDVPARGGAKPLYLSPQGELFNAQMERKADQSIAQHLAGASQADRREFFRLMKQLDSCLRRVSPDAIS